jgi:hypothetical protein
MSNFKLLSHHLELSFWAFTIRLLSESQFLRRFLPAVYKLSRKEKVVPIAKWILLYSLSGFFAGVIMGVITFYAL